MDWGRIERDMKMQTSSILQSKGSNHHQLVSYESDRVPYNAYETKEETHSSYITPIDHMDDIKSELKEIRSILNKHNDQIRAIDSTVNGRLSAAGQIEFIQSRIEQIETDIQSCTKSIAQASHESSDVVINVKNMNSRIHWLEDMMRNCSQEFVSKNSFAQLLDSCTTQLQAVNTATESARVNTSTCMNFMDSLLVAFSQLQGKRGSSVLGVEHLASLSGERQKGQIAQMLREAIRGVIAVEVEAEFRRVGERADGAVQSVRKELAAAVEEISEQVVRHGQALSDEVVRSSEAAEKSTADIAKQVDRIHRRVDGDLASIRESQQVAEIDHAELRQMLQKTDDALSRVVSVGLPSVQRNHKSLLEEVLRTEETVNDLRSRTDRLESDMKSVEAAMYKKLTQMDSTSKGLKRQETKSTSDSAAVLTETREEVEGRIDQVREELLGRVQETEQSINKLGLSIKSIEAGMDGLQAEFASVYDEVEARKAAAETQSAAAAQMKSDIVDLKVKLSNIPLEVFPQTTIQTSEGGARAGLTGVAPRTKHSAIPEAAAKSTSINSVANAQSTPAVASGSSAEKKASVRQHAGNFEQKDTAKSSIDGPCNDSDGLSSLDSEEKPVSSSSVPKNSTPQYDISSDSSFVEEENDELSADLSEDSSLSMRETSKIEDSLDESMGIIEGEHIQRVMEGRIQQSEHEKMQHEGKSDKECAPDTTTAASTNTDTGKGSSEYVVDSLGNIVPKPKHKPDGGDKNLSSVSGPPAEKVSMAPPPKLTGSLLGRGRNKPPATDTGNASLAARAALETAQAASRAKSAPSQTSRTADTIQCHFCLRRMNVDDARQHMKVCNLRTELCRFRCGAKIMVSKMDKHLQECIELQPTPTCVLEVW